MKKIIVALPLILSMTNLSSEMYYILDLKNIAQDIQLGSDLIKIGNKTVNNSEGAKIPVEERDETVWLNYLNNECGYSFADVNAMNNDLKTNQRVDCDNYNISYLPEKTGLPNIMNDIDMEGNSFSRITGLSNITTITDDFYIADNPNLTSLQGLNNLESVADNFHIDNLPLVTNLNGISSLKHAGDLEIFDMPSLTTLEGLYVSSVNYLEIENNPELKDISQLENIKSLQEGVITINSFTKKIPNDSYMCKYGINLLEDSNGNSINKSDICEEASFTAEGGTVWEQWHNFLNTCDDEASLSNGLSPKEMYTNEEQTEYHVKNSGIACANTSGNLPSSPLNITSLTEIYLQSLSLTSLPDMSSVTEIYGDVYIDDIVSSSDFSSFSGLTSVGGNFTINEGFNSWNGLSNLENVYGNFEITYTNETTLNNLSPNLKVNGNINFYGNSLSDISMLSNWDISGKSLDLGQNQISDLSVFSSISIMKDLKLDGNNFSNLVGLESLTRVNGTLSISYNNNLRDISQLSSLTDVEDLSIRNTGLSSLKGIENINAGTFYLTDNSSLTTLSDFDNLSVYDLHIGGNNLTNLNGLESLRNIGNIDIRENGITSLEGLNNLERATLIRIRQSPNVNDISALNNVTYVSSYLILNHDNEYQGKLSSDSYFCTSGYSKIRIRTTWTTPSNKNNICGAAPIAPPPTAPSNFTVVDAKINYYLPYSNNSGFASNNWGYPNGTACTYNNGTDYVMTIGEASSGTGNNPTGVTIMTEVSYQGVKPTNQFTLVSNNGVNGFFGVFNIGGTPTWMGFYLGGFVEKREGEGAVARLYQICRDDNVMSWVT